MTLPEFEGRPVLGMAIRVTGAGDGLSEPLSVAPEPHHLGDEGYLLVHYRTTQINHKPFDREDFEHYRRHETLTAIEATLVVDEDVEHLMKASRERVEHARVEAKKAEDQAAGIFDMDDAVLAAHDAGEHADLVDGCPMCDEERDVGEAEAKKGRKK